MPRLNARETALVGGFALLCTAAALAILADTRAAAAGVPVADAVDLLRRLVGA